MSMAFLYDSGISPSPHHWSVNRPQNLRFAYCPSRTVNSASSANELPALLRLSQFPDPAPPGRRLICTGATVPSGMTSNDRSSSLPLKSIDIVYLLLCCLADFRFRVDFVDEFAEVRF